MSSNGMKMQNLKKFRLQSNKTKIGCSKTKNKKMPKKNLKKFKINQFII